MRQLMSWGAAVAQEVDSGDAGLGLVTGRTVQLQFTAALGTQLYFFWLSGIKCGEPRGFIGGGGQGWI